MSGAKPQRSNSSASIRQKLKENYGALPPVQDKIALVSYLRYCHVLYDSGTKAYQRGDMAEAYINMYKFQILAIKGVPSHRDYKTKSPITYDLKAWLDKTKVPAMDLLEAIVYRLDSDEDMRIKHSREYDLIDEFDCEEAAPAPPVQQPSALTVATVEPAATAPLTTIFMSPAAQDQYNATFSAQAVAVSPPTTTQKAVDLSILSAPSPAEAVHAESALVYNVPDIEYPSEPIDGADETSRMDAMLLAHIGDYRRFSIPQPSTTTIDVTVGARHHFFLQDDFHTSYSGFLSTLPPELQLSRAATEMNRCFFIHLGIALGVHPFALQTAFRRMATAALDHAEEWEKDILASVQQYCGFVDANMLCFLWPAELSAFRVCFISGSLARPLVSCFQPPLSATSGAGRDPAQLTEIIIRCSGDHFTLLRPLPQQQQPNQGPQGFKVISKLLEDARAAKLVVQVSDAREPPAGQPPYSMDRILTGLLQQR